MKLEAAQSLDRILESAIVVYWADLMQAIETGLIHIEYGFSTSGTLDYLKVWSSVSRGHWLLACGYRIRHRHFTGLASTLIMDSDPKAWRTFWNLLWNIRTRVLPPNLGRQGLLQISTPTEEESAAAATSVKETFDHLSLTPAEPVLA
jgi:hypothetical protein